MSEGWWKEERVGHTACQVGNKTLDDVAITLILRSSFPKVAFDVAQFWVSRADYNKSRHAWEIRHSLFWMMKRILLLRCVCKNIGM